MSDENKPRRPKVRVIPDDKVEVQTPAEQKKKGGQPSAYQASFCDRVEELGRQGRSFVQIAVELGVTRQTLHNWARRHPEFFDALTRAKECALAYWEDIGEAGMTADKFNGTVWSKIISSRWPKEYGKEVEIDFQQVIRTDAAKPKQLDLSVVDPEHRDIVLNALMLMRQAAEAEEEDT